MLEVFTPIQGSRRTSCPIPPRTSRRGCTTAHFGTGPRIRCALQRWIPVPCHEVPVVANDRDHLGPDMGFQELGGHLSRPTTPNILPMSWQRVAKTKSSSAPAFSARVAVCAACSNSLISPPPHTYDRLESHSRTRSARRPSRPMRSRAADYVAPQADVLGQSCRPLNLRSRLPARVLVVVPSNIVCSGTPD
jgi:hypothetical protein